MGSAINASKPFDHCCNRDRQFSHHRPYCRGFRDNLVLPERSDVLLQSQAARLPDHRATMAHCPSLPPPVFRPRQATEVAMKGLAHEDSRYDVVLCDLDKLGCHTWPRGAPDNRRRFFVAF
jgi:hypothetical protein